MPIDLDLITRPNQMTIEEKDNLFFTLLDHLELDVIRTSDGIDLRANGDES